ncbi:MAG: hypothetical protein EXR51_02405 [Dehalococcoidia bacterium]|nr:hypothetical protein [Dehalococcoidia bacterium]
MAGTIVLVGAGEFLEGMAAIDRILMARVPDPPARVAIVPTAAAQEDPRAWTDMGESHYRRLGAQVEPVFVRDSETANDPAFSDAILRSNFVYMSGGSPGYLLDSIRDSRSWTAMLEVYHRGGILAGCSAGAMVMGGITRVRRSGMPGPPQPFSWEWAEGLGLMPNVIVAPHFDRMNEERLRGYREGMPPNFVMLGVDEHTAAVGDGNSFEVMGRSAVTVFRGESSTRYPAGERFTIL